MSLEKGLEAPFDRIQSRELSSVGFIGEKHAYWRLIEDNSEHPVKIGDRSAEVQGQRFVSTLHQDAETSLSIQSEPSLQPCLSRKV